VWKQSRGDTAKRNTAGERMRMVLGCIFGKTIALIGAAMLLGYLSVSSACLKPNEVDKYAKQLNLPEQVRGIVRQLDYDDNTKTLIDERYMLCR